MALRRKHREPEPEPTANEKIGFINLMVPLDLTVYMLGGEQVTGLGIDQFELDQEFELRLELIYQVVLAFYLLNWSSQVVGWLRDIEPSYGMPPANVIRELPERHQELPQVAAAAAGNMHSR